MQAIGKSTNLDQYQIDLLIHFGPAGAFTQIKYDQLDRLQKNGKRLADLITEIKEMSFALRFKYSEREIVDNVLEGLNPSERARLVFAQRFSNFHELDELYILTQNIQFADTERETRLSFNSTRRGSQSIAQQVK